VWWLYIQSVCWRCCLARLVCTDSECVLSTYRASKTTASTYRLYEGEANENFGYYLFFIMNDMVCWTMTHIQTNSYFIHCYATSFLHDGFNCWLASGVSTWCAWPGWGESVTELMPFTNYLVHLYTCCSNRHASPYWTFIRRWISMALTPSL